MSPNVTIEVMVAFPAWSDRLPGVADLCETAARAAFAAANPSFGAAEVGILLTDAAQSRILNRDYRGRDEPTNVLAFSVLDVPAMAKAVGQGNEMRPFPIGDIVLAFETCVDEASAEDKSMAGHLSHLVVHGMLHLLGYDHQTGAEAERMERLEICVLATLDIPNPYEEA